MKVEKIHNAKDSIISGLNRDTIEIILTIEDDYIIFHLDGNPINWDSYLALLYKYSDGKKDMIQNRSNDLEHDF